MALPHPPLCYFHSHLLRPESGLIYNLSLKKTMTFTEIQMSRKSRSEVFKINQQRI